MNINTLEFFGFKEDPFKITPDPAYYYPSVGHKECMASLEYSVEAKEGFTLISGEPGTGKTTILKVFIEKWKEMAEIALVLTPKLNPEEMFLTIIADLGIDFKSSNKNELINRLRDFLIEKSEAGKFVIIIVDEAQHLSVDTMEELRLLSNFESHNDKLLHIIFFCQPELEEKLKANELRQVNQRIITRCRLKPLNQSEVFDYINYRLTKAGKGFLRFDERARKTIYAYSKGIPRFINILCTRVLMSAYLKEADLVTKYHVDMAIKSLLPDKERPRFNKNYLYAACGVLFVIMAVLAYNTLGSGNSETLKWLNLSTLTSYFTTTPPTAATQKAMPVSTPKATPAKTPEKAVQEETPGNAIQEKTPEKDGISSEQADSCDVKDSMPPQGKTQSAPVPATKPVSATKPTPANKQASVTTNAAAKSRPTPAAGGQTGTATTKAVTTKAVTSKSETANRDTTAGDSTSRGGTSGVSSKAENPEKRSTYGMEQKSGVIKARSAKVHTEPNKDSGLVMGLIKGQKVKVLDTANDADNGKWYFIQVDEDKEGWVSGSVIDVK